MTLSAIFPSLSMRGSEREQQSKVDATLRAVERVLSAHKTLRTGIRDGRARVDAMVEAAIAQQAKPLGSEHAD
jgi:hypothetical protein